MANPDGVAEGCTRLTGRDGADLNIDALAQSDPVAITLKNWLDRLKSDLWAFLQAFDCMVRDGRTWYADQIGTDLKPGDRERQILKRY